MANGQRVQALRDFTYGAGGVGKVARGQVFNLAGARNDGRLLQFRFVAPFDGSKVFTDSQGRDFAEEWQRDAANRPPPVDATVGARAKVTPARVVSVGR